MAVWLYVVKRATIQVSFLCQIIYGRMPSEELLNIDGIPSFVVYMVDGVVRSLREPWLMGLSRGSMCKLFFRSQVLVEVREAPQRRSLRKRK